MLQEQEVTEPDWDSPLSLRLTPALLMHSLMTTATAVHTGYASCVDDKLVVNDLISMDGSVGNYVRLVEQDFYEEEDPETVWHDWTLEISIGKILTTGHWQISANASPMEWEWTAREAEKAFGRACVLIGRRVRQGLVVDEPVPVEQPYPRMSRH